jgi:ABC-type cobalamin transport system ATPase subunit
MHDLAMASLAADDAWLLHDGQLAAAGLTCDVLEATRLQKVFGVGFRWATDVDGQPRLMADSPFVPRPQPIA